MIKRFFTAIVVFFVSFVLLWITIFGLIYLVDCSFSLGEDVLRINVATQINDPQALVQHIQLSWQNIEDGYGKDPAAFEKEIHAFWQRFAKQDIPMLEAIATVVALVGAIIFGASCLAESISYGLLFWRRLITVPLVFGYGFMVSLMLFYWIANFICVTIVSASSADFQRVAHVAQFHKDDDGWMILGVVIAAFLTAFFITYRATRWDGLPWCRTPTPVRQPHRTRKAL